MLLQRGVPTPPWVFNLVALQWLGSKEQPGKGSRANGGQALPCRKLPSMPSSGDWSDCEPCLLLTGRTIPAQPKSTAIPIHLLVVKYCNPRYCAQSSKHCNPFSSLPHNPKSYIYNPTGKIVWHKAKLTKCHSPEDIKVCGTSENV